MESRPHDASVRGNCEIVIKSKITSEREKYESGKCKRFSPFRSRKSRVVAFAWTLVFVEQHASTCTSIGSDTTPSVEESDVTLMLVGENDEADVQPSIPQPWGEKARSIEVRF